MAVRPSECDAICGHDLCYNDRASVDGGLKPCQKTVGQIHVNINPSFRQALSRRLREPEDTLSTLEVETGSRNEGWSVNVRQTTSRDMRVPLRFCPFVQWYSHGFGHLTHVSRHWLAATSAASFLASSRISCFSFFSTCSPTIRSAKRLAQQQGKRAQRGRANSCKKHR